MSTCLAPHCDRSSSGSGCGFGYCNKHLRRYRKYGDPLGGRAFDGEGLEYLRRTIRDATPDACIIWPYGKTEGYGALVVDGKHRRAHEWVCQQTHGPRPSRGWHAAHSCDERACVNPNHISWVTHAENLKQMIDRGRSHKGPKLTPDLVRFIRSELPNTTGMELAERLGVTPGCIYLAARGKTWGWVK